MMIKVLGLGCMNCKTLEHRTREAIEALHLDASVQKVDNYQEIAAYGIMRTPGLVIDEKVVLSGSVPKVEDLKKLLLQHGAVPQV
jgi:small redox-active disulfide protein 2